MKPFRDNNLNAKQRAGKQRESVRGVITRVIVQPYKCRSCFAVELETTNEQRWTICLLPPIVESQFIYQQGLEVLLPIKKRGEHWVLRQDPKALAVMKKFGCYDPARRASAFASPEARASGWLGFKRRIDCFEFIQTDDERAAARGKAKE